MQNIPSAIVAFVPGAKSCSVILVRIITPSTKFQDAIHNDVQDGYMWKLQRKSKIVYNLNKFQ